MPGLTEEQLATLTDEERAAVLAEDDTTATAGTDLDDDDDGDDGQKAAAAKPEGADEAKGAAPAGDKPTEPAKAADASAEKPAEGQAKAADPAKATVEAPAATKTEAEAPFVPPPNAYTAPAQSRPRLAEIEKQIDEIEKRFDEGEITATDRRTQIRELERESKAIEADLTREEMSFEASFNYWRYSVVKPWMKDHPEYAEALVYTDDDGRQVQVKNPLRDALNEHVQALQAESVKKNGTLFAQFDERLLEKAHKILVKTGVVRESRAAATGSGARPSRPELPPTLAHVPASDPTPVSDVDDGGVFAALDRLNGEEYEAAVAKLAKTSPDLYARYMAA